MNCPHCSQELVMKREEDYKKFLLCTNNGCPIVSVIFTISTKASWYNLNEVMSK